MTMMLSSLNGSDGSTMEDFLEEGDCATNLREDMEDNTHLASIGWQNYYQQLNVLQLKLAPMSKSKRGNIPVEN